MHRRDAIEVCEQPRRDERETTCCLVSCEVQTLAFRTFEKTRDARVDAEEADLQQRNAREKGPFCLTCFDSFMKKHGMSCAEALESNGSKRHSRWSSFSADGLRRMASYFPPNEGIVIMQVISSILHRFVCAVFHACMHVRNGNVSGR